MRVLEIETLAEMDRRVGAGATTARGWHVQSVDLRERTDALAGLDVTGAVFLGCRFADGVDEEVRRRGALVFPAVPDVPFDPYRAGLYSPDELYDGLDAEALTFRQFDGRASAGYTAAPPIERNTIPRPTV